MEISQIDTNRYLSTLPRSCPGEYELMFQQLKHWRSFMDDVLEDKSIFEFLDYLSSIVEDEVTNLEGSDSYLVRLEQIDESIEAFRLASHAYTVELSITNDPEILSILLDKAMEKYDILVQLLTTTLHRLLPQDL